MSHGKILIAAALAAAVSLAASGQACATATTLLFDDQAAGTSLVVSVDGSVTLATPPQADISGVANTFGEFVTGSFSIPQTTFSILDPGTSLVSDQLQFSAISLGSDSLTISAFISNDGPPLPLDISNPIIESGLIQTLLFQQDESGNTLTVQFLSERDAPQTTTESLSEPSSFAVLGAALAALAAFGWLVGRTAKFRA